MSYFNALSTFIKFSVALASLTWLLGVVPAFAAPINYTANTTISLTSPVTSFTVISGSVADGLTVNAGNFTVTLSSATGGSFTVTNSTRDFDITTGGSGSGGIPGAGGTLTGSCTSGVASTTLTQDSGSHTYTFTPTSGACGTAAATAAATAVGYGTSGGGGGGGGYVAPTTTVTATTTATTAATTTTATTDTTAITPTTMSSAVVSSIQAQIAALLVKLQELQAKAAQQGVSAPSSVSSGSTASVPAGGFVKSLTSGARGNDVSSLQQFLINQASGPEAQKLSGFGATGYFGGVTTKALAEFQKKVGIEPAIGYFGPKTRAYINSMSSGQ